MHVHAEAQEALMGTMRPHLSSRLSLRQAWELTLRVKHTQQLSPPCSPANSRSFFLTSQPPAPSAT